MNLLLDTHIVLCWLGDHPRLPSKARELIADEANNVSVSVASLWEIAIKAGRGRLGVSVDEVEQAARDSGFDILAIEAAHVRMLAVLPQKHRDPFDRMLIAQARSEPRYLLTSDKLLRGYGETVLMV